MYDIDEIRLAIRLCENIIKMEQKNLQIFNMWLNKVLNKEGE